ncbi:MAG: hypothetical protein KY391_01365 [Actinobacteria bacterium]|nr:hypothetical protein [Actinomycetota bacterium]
MRAPMGLGGPMTAAGAIELPLLAVQLLTSMLATWAGIRVVDDIRHFMAAKARRAAERSS